MRGCNELADLRRITTTRERINGGHNGLAECRQYYANLGAWIKDDFALTAFVRRSVPEAPEAVDLDLEREVSDDAYAEDTGLPGWYDPVAEDEFDIEDEDEFAPDGSIIPKTAPLSPRKSEEDAQAGQVAESGRAGQESGNTAALPTEVLSKERPSTFTKWLVAVKTAIGGLITTIVAWFGSEDLREVVKERAQSADAEFWMKLLVVAGYLTGGMLVGLAFVWLASKVWDHSSERASRLNSEKLAFAASPDSRTVEFSLTKKGGTE
jgi:hypothetical protein